MEMQSHNLAVSSTKIFLSYILLHLQQNFRTSIHSHILILMKWRNTVAYKIVDTADSKKKVKEDDVFVPLQFKFKFFKQKRVFESICDRQDIV